MTRISRSVLLHRLKTAGYAISSVVLISWVTDALNEGLMFKPLLRYLYPQAVENYQHPFTDHPSLMIWLVPLLAALFLMFATSTLAVHHFKRRHLYRLSQPVAAPAMAHLVTRATGGQALLDALPMSGRPPLHTLHALYLQPNELTPLEAPCAAIGIRLRARALPDTPDIHQQYTRLGHILGQIRHEAGPDERIAFDLSHLPPELASAATLACLENDVMLCYLDAKRVLRTHRVICEMRE
ncbi:hypothetical protein ACFZAI_08590 [Achromobacter sp. NPDC008082]|uniref:hypothetical protein n=1 Tax=Achromobacter sp. NPDC008082 TaxID=3363888 RepID=UPI0036E5A198